MISTEQPTDTAAEADTETMAEWHARRRRERHQQLLDNLEYLADLIADAGPLSEISGDAVGIKVNIGVFDGSIVEQVDRLHAVADALGARVEERPNASGTSVHYAVDVEPAEGIEIHAFVVAGCAGLKPEEIAEAAAAHQARLAARVTVDYQVEHDDALAEEVRVALAARGVDARTDLADSDHGHPTVTRTGDHAFVDHGDFGAGLPALEQCVSVEAYVGTIAAYARADFDSTPCPARPDTAFRAIRDDGAALTAYACAVYHGDQDGDLREEGFTVVRLRPGQVPATAVCGERIEVGL